jgi:hypothetical protein
MSPTRLPNGSVTDAENHLAALGDRVELGRPERREAVDFGRDVVDVDAHGAPPGAARAGRKRASIRANSSSSSPKRHSAYCGAPCSGRTVRRRVEHARVPRHGGGHVFGDEVEVGKTAEHDFSFGEGVFFYARR